MRFPTLLFYGVATLCLGMLSVPIAPRALSLFFRRDDWEATISNLWTGGTLFLAAFFVSCAVYSTFAPTGDDRQD